jgi:SAM-dependent methyltransferase
MASARKNSEDVFGRALLDWARGGTSFEVLERVDGFAQLGAGPEVYLAPFRDWPGAERASIRSIRGRVVDVGCGAGRVALELQRRGVDVVGLDTSPLALRAARFRGVNQVLRAPLEDLGSRGGDFDTFVLFGNNFGIFGTPRRAHSVLKGLAASTIPSARILVESTSAYFGGAPGFDRTYYRLNKARGLAPGQGRFRFRYKDLRGPWFNWLYVSPREMRELLRGTGWHQSRVFSDGHSEPYVAVLEKDA